MGAIANKFIPDYAIHPGEILEETLEAQHISKTEFAERTGLTQKTVSLIIAGKNPVTAESALSFENVLGISADIWTNLDSDYRLFKARQRAQESLKEAVEWSKEFPLGELAKRGYIPKVKDAEEKAAALLKFFRVKSPDAWMRRYGNMTVAFRKSAAFSSDYNSVVAWLRMAEVEAEKIQTYPYNRREFEAVLSEIRKITNQKPRYFEPKMKDYCRKAGLAVVFVSELPKTRLSGATQWLNPHKAMIALSLRHKTNDHFWFTFFHEAGHIIKHGKKDVYIDETDQRPTTEENDANMFATGYLIPESEYRKFITTNQRFSRKKVEEFARRIGVAPGIVVGRLQHD